MSDAGDLRAALATGLGAALDVPFIAGRRDAPIVADNRGLGCAWPLRKGEIPGRRSHQTVSVLVRVFLPRKLRRVVSEATDPGPLEQLADTIEDWAAANYRIAPFWIVNCVDVEFDLGDGFSVTATFVGQKENRASAGGA